MSDEGVCRTAPATPDLLKIYNLRVCKYSCQLTRAHSLADVLALALDKVIAPVGSQKSCGLQNSSWLGRSANHLNRQTKTCFESSKKFNLTYKILYCFSYYYFLLLIIISYPPFRFQRIFHFNQEEPADTWSSVFTKTDYIQLFKPC